MTFEPSSNIACGSCKVNFMGAASAVSVNRGNFAKKTPLWSASFVRCPELRSVPFSEVDYVLYCICGSDFNPCHEFCPLYGGCPPLGGSVMGGSTVHTYTQIYIAPTFGSFR